MALDYKSFVKKFVFPEEFSAPTILTLDDLTAKPLTRADLKADMDAVNSSLEVIRKTRGGSWPEEAVSEKDNFLDLAWHEREFKERSSFAYAVYDSNSNYVACFYLYPMGFRTELTDELMGCDMDASWWVTAAAYEQGYYPKLYKALQQWLREFPVKKVYYSNKEIPS